MKTKFSIVMIVVILLIMVTVYCVFGNKMIFDFNQRFNYAYVVWPDGRTECLELAGWKDYDGEQIQIKTTEGEVYLFSSYNCVLAVEKRS